MVQRTPITATTTINSTSVKPRSAQRALLQVMIVPSGGSVNAPLPSKSGATGVGTLYLVEFPTMGLVSA
jgi:hypothetical protein